jgi:ABC-type antimicrobial peptide transport system permease subunit
MAFGANRNQIVYHWLKQSFRLTVLGILLGWLLSFTGSRLLSGMLFGVSALDRTAFVVSALFLAAAAGFACYIPARKASRMDPAVCLRSF